MKSCQELRRILESGEGDARLAELYALDGKECSLAAAKTRVLSAVNEFEKLFGEDKKGATLFSGPGRTEIGGNHTDHQHGHVLCGSVDLDMLACAAPNGRNVIRVVSQGYPPVEVSLDQLNPVPEEESTSAALVRGVAAGVRERGGNIGGFDAYVTSNVLSGSGLSSSAAYEVLMGNILNHFFCGGSLSPVEIAKIAQAAENRYFGKPCGLMDQMGSSVGGAVAIDFADPAAPIVTRVGYDFSRSGHALCIVDTGSCHADLTDDYADITREMGAVAACMGRKLLRELPWEEFRSAIPRLRTQCGDRAVLRALHYYEDDRRAQEEAKALEMGDFPRFLELVNASGLSSALHLQNTWSIADPAHQAIPVALAVGRELLTGSGAIRVHGGGFAGTIQAFVPNERLEAFRNGMEEVLGPGMCHILHIRPQGGCVIFD